MIAVAARQRGVAILTAMLVVAIGTVIAVNLMWSASLDLRRTASALAADQGWMYLQGAEAWAGDILRQDQVDSIESDHLGESWAIELPPMPVDGGAIAGRVEDLQGRFNLNNLVTPQGQEDEIARRQFERLLVSLELDPALAGVALDWLDADGDTGFPFGAEDATYAGFDPPYRTPNFVITSPSELLAMSGQVGKKHGGLPVRIDITGETKPFYGLLLFCSMPSSLIEHASLNRHEKIVVPENHRAKARSGQITSILKIYKIETRLARYLRYYTWILWLADNPDKLN